jgi:type IV pilus assembly protein PilN
MAHVNLLPWRETLRQKQKQNYFAVLFATAAICATFFWLIGQMFDQQIGNQNARNQYLTNEINQLDALIGEIQKVKDSKAEIQKRMALIEQLQSSRNLAPILLNELVQVVPKGVSFETMRRTQNKVIIDGISDSNNRLSEFIRKLEGSRVFLTPELSSIIADTSASDAVSTFKLEVPLDANADNMPEKESAE